MAVKKWVWKETAEVIGVLGIIGGIVFLGFELRQNNELMKLQAASELEARRYSTVDVVLNNPEYFDLLMKDEAELSEAERVRLTLLGIRIILNWESLYESVLRGEVGEDYARRAARAVYWRPTLNYGADLAWETYKDRASPGFITWMEENVIQAGPP